MYSVKCKRMTDTQNLQHAISKNNRKMLRGSCSVCGSRKSQFITTESQQGGDLTNSINKFTSKLKFR